MSTRAERYLAEIGIAVYKRRVFAPEPAGAPSAFAGAGSVALIATDPPPAVDSPEA